MLLELERLYNHVNDLGALCNDVGHSILQSHFARVRERLLRINAEVTGHRLLRGGVVLGGAELRALPDPQVLRAIGVDLSEIVELALGHTVVLDRFTGTAPLSAEAARDLGVLGYVARASGLRTDARFDHPFTELGPAFTLATRTSGDVLARFQIRAEEINTSIALISELVSGLSMGTARAWPPPAAPHSRPSMNGTPEPPLGESGTGGVNGASGVGIVEGWRGTIVHRVEFGEDGTLARVKIVDPSFFNWPALPAALAGAIVPDFPLVNKSFNLSYAGNDL